MKKERLKDLTERGLELFSKLATAYKYNGISIGMTDHVTQRGGILSEFVREGGTKAYIAGGKDGQQFFKNIPQYTLNEDTFCSRNQDSISQIVGALPKDVCGDKTALFLYTPQGDCLWGKALVKHTGTTIVATNEQNFRSYFEEKNNLSNILTVAGLEKHIIPSKIVRDKNAMSFEQASELYNSYASKDGKIVVQFCGEGNTEKGGGYSTQIFDNAESFAKVFSEERESYVKVAKFITGVNSNLSICAGNTVPSTNMLGAAKNNLMENESRYELSTIYSLLDRAEKMGINEDNIVVNVQPGTLKVVGAPQLTSISTNGVGNQLNYRYDDQVLNDIYNLGTRLGTLMALCGKVGLCGADLIITQEGEVYVNEINDRQQGPTENAGLNNEANGLPALHRTAFLMNYGDMKNPEFVSYLKEVNSYSKEIYEEALNIPSPFYIKFISKFNSVAKTDIVAGNYDVLQDNEGNWHWDIKNPKPEERTEVDLSSGNSTVTINTVSAKEGDFFPKETQLLRISGVSVPGSMPFVINEEGKSTLSSQWEAPIQALYDTTLTNLDKVETAYEEESQAEENFAEQEGQATVLEAILRHIASNSQTATGNGVEQ